MSDETIRASGYVESPERQIDMVFRMFDRFKNRGVVMPEGQRHIYEAIAGEVTGQSVADLGCGVGLGSFILSATASVDGYDLSDNQVRFATQVYGRGGIRFFVQDIYKPRVTSFSYDTVVCVEVIEHLQRWEPCVAMIIDMLADGGVAYISTPNRDNPIHHPTDPSKCHEFHVREWSAGEFGAFLRKRFRSVELLGPTLAPLQPQENPMVARCRR